MLCEALGGVIEQPVAPRRSVDRAALRQKCAPFYEDGGEEMQALLPMRRKVGDDIDHAIVKQVGRIDILHQQAIHRRAGFAGEPQQGGAPRRVISHRLRDQTRQREQAPLGIDGGRHRAGAQGVEQRPQRLVEVEIADHHHARHQQAHRTFTPFGALPRVADERLAHRPHGARTRQQQGQPCETQPLLGIAWDQTRNERIGETAMGSDGIDLWRAAFSHVRARPRTPRYVRAVRPRSTAR